MSHAVADVATPAPAETSPSRRRWPWRLLLAVIIALVVLGGAALAARTYDRAHADRLLPGVRVAGVDVGGEPAADVVGRLQSQVPLRGARRVSVTAAGTEVAPTLAELGLRSDAAAAVARAEERARSMGLVSRLWHRVMNKPVDGDYPVRYEVDRRAVSSAVGRLAAMVDRDPVDARIDTSTGMVTVVPAVPGQGLDRPTGVERLLEKATDLANSPLDGEAAVVEVPLLERAPKVTRFADVILVRTGENKLYHYEDGALVKAYPIATGTARYPTPKGQFQITLLRRNPTWVNPDPGGWGKSLPARIGPGPGNPLGTRAMNLNSPGIRIHGTRNIASLGQAASHGCIRMAIADSEELFERVAVGTPVVIIKGPDVAPPAAATPITSLGDPNAPVDLEAG